MSRKLIEELEKDLRAVVKRYETEYEMIAGEMCGVLGIIQTDIQIRALLPYCTDLLKDLLGIVATSENGPPVGEIIHIPEGKEGDEDMET